MIDDTFKLQVSSIFFSKDNFLFHVPLFQSASPSNRCLTDLLVNVTRLLFITTNGINHTAFC